MKNSLLLFLLLPAFGFAQECKLKKSTDPFTHETKLSTGFLPFNTGSLKIALSVDATPSAIDFFIWIKDAGVCFESSSFAELIFEGEKSRMRIKNTGSMNCDGAFHFSFKNADAVNAQLAKIGTKKIASIKLVGTNKIETMLNLGEEQKELLLNSAKCVTEEGKTIVKK